MHRLLILWTVVGIAATGWLVSRAAAQQEPQTTPSAVPAADATSQQAADAAIRAAAKEFTKAFDRGDAEAVAQHFTTDAVYIDDNGQRFAGRKSIQQEYATLFAKRSDLRLQLAIDSIRLLNATTAIEEGRVALSPQPPGSMRVMSRYTAVHTRQDGKWLKSFRRREPERTRDDRVFARRLL